MKTLKFASEIYWPLAYIIFLLTTCHLKKNVKYVHTPKSLNVGCTVYLDWAMTKLLLKTDNLAQNQFSFLPFFLLSFCLLLSFKMKAKGINFYDFITFFTDKRQECKQICRLKNCITAFIRPKVNLRACV